MKNNNSKNIGIFLKATPLVFFLLFSFSTTSLFSQENNEQMKRLQRSIYIFNFAEQIVWKNIDQMETFNIGVLGKDRTSIDLKSLSLKRKIKNKPVLVSNFNSINDIGNIQLLYVNKSSNYNIDQIIAVVSQKNILLITEDYDYNSSMINMVNVGNSFEYEINTGHILNADLKYATSLKSDAVSSSQKWKELYQKSESALKNEKQKSDLQKETLNEELKKIKTQEIKIDTFSKRISKQNRWIEELKDENEIQRKKFEEKIVIEAELEKRIKNKIDTIAIQENLIVLTKKKIDSQKVYLHDLGEEIDKKDNFLKQKIAEVNIYKRINWLLVAIASLIFLIGLLIYINYRSKLKLTKILVAQNESIEKQSKILEFKNKELEQFAYITSHDLKEPLITISGMIDLIIEDYGHKMDDTGKMTLHFINESSERMRNLIDSLLEYSRLGRTQEAKNINTNGLIESIKNDLNNVIVRTNATLTAKNLPVIKGTEFEIRLLFQNLISNGIKFIDAKTKPIILIDCKKIIDPIHQHQGVYEFSIKDNGIGIEEKHKERIFSIFQRLHSREEYEGTGIGLAHCKKIIEAHGGSIWLESQLGKGTTFYFTIPYNDTI